MYLQNKTSNFQFNLVEKNIYILTIPPTTTRFISVLFTAVFFLNTNCLAQSISGTVYNEENQPIPFVNIYVRQLESGTSTDENGKYFLTLNVGDYDIVYSAIGLETQNRTLVVTDESLVQDIFMKSSEIELDEIVVKASKRDPAYAIIQNVIDNKKKYLSEIKSSRSKIYIKATENIDRKEKKAREAKKENEKRQEETMESEGNFVDPFEKEKQDLAARLNMVEMEMTLNYQFPKKYKEERTAYKAYGDKSGLFIPIMGESEFNFYRNMVRADNISEMPIISPFSRTSILSYKYKLISTTVEDGLQVHKIKVIPRKKGNLTVNGFVYINDDLWNINRLELSYDKGGLKFFDEFTIKQSYEQIGDSLWIPYRQEFVYQTKQGRNKTFRGSTIMHYSEFENNFDFREKFFKNEVSVTTKEAYERDTLYWSESRPEPLTIEEQKLVSYKDSLETVVNAKEYQDSIQIAYNKVKFLEIIWDGVGFRNNEKKSHLFIGPMPSMINFSSVGGFRVATPFISYRRRFEDGRMWRTFANFSVGIKNKDYTGQLFNWVRYNPHKLADASIRFGRNFSAIFDDDAIINQLSSSNYIQHDFLELEHRIELSNGLYLRTGVEFSDRRSIEDLDRSTFLDNWIANITNSRGEVLVSTLGPLEFDNYKATISTIRLSYTPGQKFMTEPNRKIILGSKWPTFSVTHIKGWNGLADSDVDFDYLEAEIEQDIILGVFGSSKYNLKSGKFLNQKKLKFLDVKRFQQSNPWIMISPLQAFQSLDTALQTTKLFFEAHYVHHFNGALINNIPFIKRTRIRVVTGASALWLSENNFQYQEIFAGIERVFKLGPRRRLKLGVHGILANSNQIDSPPAIKFSIDIIDTWQKDWSF